MSTYRYRLFHDESCLAKIISDPEASLERGMIHRLSLVEVEFEPSVSFLLRDCSSSALKTHEHAGYAVCSHSPEPISQGWHA